MERRGRNIRKGFLKGILPFIRWLPLTTASGLLLGFGKFEYRMHKHLRQAFDEAVGEAPRDAPVRLGCCHHQPRPVRQPDPLADPRHAARRRVRPREESMFRISGREHLDTAIAQGKGCIVLTSHFGAHMLPAHWLYRHDYPLRLYMERPRNISRFMVRRFATDGPLSQDKLFISRKGDSKDAASSILRATRVLKSGMLLFLAGDVRWSGQMTEEARFLGRTLRFSTTWIMLAALSQAPVVIVYCRVGPDRRYYIDFHSPFYVPKDTQQQGQTSSWVQHFMDVLEQQIRFTPRTATTTCSGTRTKWPELLERVHSCQEPGQDGFLGVRCALAGRIRL